MEQLRSRKRPRGTKQPPSLSPVRKHHANGCVVIEEAFRRPDVLLFPGCREGSGHSYSSVVEVFDAHAIELPEFMAVFEMNPSGDVLTWIQLQTLSIQIAQALASNLNGAVVVSPVAICTPRSSAWFAATVAVLRIRLPFVWLSVGDCHAGSPAAILEREVKRLARNRFALQLLEPCCVISDRELANSVGDGFDISAPVLLLSDLLGRDFSQVGYTTARESVCRAEDILCYMFTGGSTGTPKCVIASHAMALHEVRRYPSVVSLTPADRVLQHTSVFWPASAWGQIDIALAFGSTTCVSLSASPTAAELRTAGVTVLGMSPSQLAALTPDDVPQVRCVFSWGEALPASLAASWRAHASLRVIELLISTEYWLSFYSDSSPSGSGNKTFQMVDDVDVAVLPLRGLDSRFSDEGLSADVGSVGELCIRGDAVSLGYFTEDDTSAFISGLGGTFFHTRDVVALAKGSRHKFALQFHGRSDYMIKVGAEFVSLADVEARLEAFEFCGGLSACVLPQLSQVRGPKAHAFVAPRTCSNAANLNSEVPRLLFDLRRAIPNGAILHILPALPRDAITGKVNRRALTEYVVSGDLASEPLGLDVQGEMLWRVLRRYPVWWTLLGLFCWCDALAAYFGECGPTRGVWVGSSLRMIVLSYVWLATFHLMPGVGFLQFFPFGRAGFVLALSAAGSFSCGDEIFGGPTPFVRRVSQVCWMALALVGICVSARRRCLLTWPLTFWVAIPHSLDREMFWWLLPRTWVWWACEVLPSMLGRVERALYRIKSFLTFRGALSCLQPMRQPDLKKAPIWVVGSKIALWECEQKAWCPGVVLSCDAGWVTVRCKNANGTEFTRSSRCSADILKLAPSALEGLGASIANCSIRTIARLTRPLGGLMNKLSAIMCNYLCMFRCHDLEFSAPEGESSGAHSNSKLELRYRGHSLNDWHAFEREWWDKCVVDFVSVESHCTPERQGGVAASSEVINNVVHSSDDRMLRLVEKHLHLSPVTLQTSLVGADSLSFMALCRALRVDLGCELQPDVAMRCETVEELLRQAADRQNVDHPTPLVQEQKKLLHAVYFAPGQLHSKCAWLYEVDGPLDPEIAACAAKFLVERHEALRYALCDPPELVPFVQQPAGLHIALHHFLQALLARSASPSVVSAVGAFLGLAQAVIADGLKAAWPRVGPIATRMSDLPCLIHVAHFDSWAGVVEGVESHSRSFKPPFSMALFTLDTITGGDGGVSRGTDSGVRSFVHFVCTHAFSDGFSCVPLISDFADIYDELVLSGQGGSSGPQIARPGAAAAQLPSAFSVLEARLFDALDLRPADVALDKSTLRTTEYYSTRPSRPLAGKREAGQYNHQIQIERGGLAALRKCAAAYAVPLDLALLGAVAGALLRAGVSDEKARLDGNSCAAKQELTFALYAPMRDSAANEAMVGLFSDWRELTLRADARDGNISVLGLVVRLAALVRGRFWRHFNPLQNEERILVNILALDERPHGLRAFRQTRLHEYDEATWRCQRERSWRRGYLRPMRLTLEQYDVHTWWLSMDLSDSHFPPSWCRRFVSCLQQTVQDIVSNPMAGLL